MSDLVDILQDQQRDARIAALEADLKDTVRRRDDAEAELAKLKDGYEILATKLSEANAELVRLETQPREGGE